MSRKVFTENFVSFIAVLWNVTKRAFFFEGKGVRDISCKGKEVRDISCKGKEVRDISCKGKEEKEIKENFMPTIFH